MANDIHDVVSEYLALSRSGRNLKGVCPFHSEKTPSFFVNPERQSFHCFGCGAGGNVFTFVMRMENLSFPEAVRKLAARRGIPLPADTPRDSAEERQKQSLLQINAEALDFFRRQLASPAGAEAREYLSRRGIQADIVERFRLGWSPKGWDALRNHLRKKDFPEELARTAGLTTPGTSGRGDYDRFRERIIFPIANAHGEVVAFGGRVIDPAAEPKYLNSPETPLYHKGKVLYGLDVARQAIRRHEGEAVLVEGYLDLISAHAAGFDNVVASLGTALTRDQVKLLKRHAQKAVILYDGDPAGQAAARRTMELFLAEELSAWTAILPPGDDPDSLVRGKGAEALREVLRNAIPLMEHIITTAAEQWRPQGAEGKAKAAGEIIDLLAKVRNDVLAGEYLRFAARALDVREERLQHELDKRRHGTGAAFDDPPAAPPRRSAPPAVEELLVRSMLHEAEVTRLVRERVPLSAFSHDACRAIAAALFSAAGRPDERDGGLPVLENEEAAALAARLAAERPPEEDSASVARDCLDRMERNRRAAESKSLHEKIRQAEGAGQHAVLIELMRIKQDIARIDS
jgi:DNA primase